MKDPTFADEVGPLLESFSIPDSPVFSEMVLEALDHPFCQADLAPWTTPHENACPECGHVFITHH